MKKALFAFVLLPFTGFAQKHEINLFLLGNQSATVKYDYNNPTSSVSAHDDEKARQLRYALGYTYITEKNTELGVSAGLGADKNNSEVTVTQDLYLTGQYTDITTKWYYISLSAGKRFQFHKMLLHATVSVPFELQHVSNYKTGASDLTLSAGSTPHTQDATVKWPNSMIFGVSFNGSVSYPIVKHLYLSAGIDIAQKWSRLSGTATINSVENYKGTIYNDNATQQTKVIQSAMSIQPRLGLRLIF